jgi:hypothetical protein
LHRWKEQTHRRLQEEIGPLAALGNSKRKKSALSPDGRKADIRCHEEALSRAQKESFPIDRAGFLKVVGDTHMSAKRAKSSDSSKKPSISAKIRCTLTPQGQRNQIKKGKSGQMLQEIDIQIKTEDVDLFDVDEDGNLSFMLALAPIDDLPEKSEVIRLVQEAIEKKKRVTALQEQEDE